MEDKPILEIEFSRVKKAKKITLCVKFRGKKVSPAIHEELQELLREYAYSIPHSEKSVFGIFGNFESLKSKKLSGNIPPKSALVVSLRRKLFLLTKSLLERETKENDGVKKNDIVDLDTRLSEKLRNFKEVLEIAIKAENCFGQLSELHQALDKGSVSKPVKVIKELESIREMLKIKND